MHTKTYNVEFHRLPELDMVLAIGQSNMAGRAPFDAYTAPMDDVYLLTSAGGVEIAANPLNKYPIYVRISVCKNWVLLMLVH